MPSRQSKARQQKPTRPFGSTPAPTSAPRKLGARPQGVRVGQTQPSVPGARKPRPQGVPAKLQQRPGPKRGTARAK
jgi:hypothetical protein